MSTIKDQIAEMDFLDDDQLKLLKRGVLTMGELADLFKVERNTAKRIAKRLELEVHDNTADAKSKVVFVDDKLLSGLKRSRPMHYRGRKGQPPQHYKRGNLAG